MPSIPPCPCANTGRTLATGLFSPVWVTSQIGPTFSVINIHPSGKNARRHGSLKVATFVMTNGKLASGFCAPRLVWAEAPVATKAVSTPFSPTSFSTASIFVRHRSNEVDQGTMSKRPN
jgi:hypothetical protein